MRLGLAPTFRVARRTLTRNWARSLRLILLISIPAFAGTIAAIIAQTNAAAAALEASLFREAWSVSQHCYNTVQASWVRQWTQVHGKAPTIGEIQLLFWRHHPHQRIACDATLSSFGGQYMGPNQQSATPLVVLAVVGLVAVVLFSLAAFAANTRNMRVDLGLVAVVGATPDQARYTVALQGLIIGVLGTLVGMGVVLVGALAFPRTVSSLIGVGPKMNPVISPLTFLAAFTTLAATLVAAWLPARNVGRTPPLETLRGEARRAAMRPHFPKLAVTSLVLGLALLCVGMLSRHFGWFEPPKEAALTSTAGWIPDNGSGWLQTNAVTLFLTVGLALTFIGFAGIVPQMLARIAALGPRFPVGLQLALRDIARSKHRTVPVATMVLVMTAFGAWLLIVLSEGTPYTAVFDHDLPEWVYLLDVVALVVAVVLMAAGLATALTVRDADGDFRILGALGAPPGLHRALTAAQSAVVALVGTVLGILFGIALGIASVTSRTDGTRLVMPWIALLGLAIAAPAAAALVTWMITRPESPKKTANWYGGNPIFRS
jgi:putative ABC transport system permease protein